MDGASLGNELRQRHHTAKEQAVRCVCLGINKGVELYIRLLRLVIGAGADVTDDRRRLHWGQLL